LTVTDVTFQLMHYSFLHNFKQRCFFSTLKSFIGIGIGIGVGIGFLAAILLASIVFVILVRVKMIEFNRRRANKPLGKS